MDRNSKHTPIGTLVSVGGHDVHVREDGPVDATPIVLVHGFLGSMRWFDKLVPLLADDYRVVRIDLLGHGHSSKESHGYSPEEQGRTLAALLAELQVVKPTVVGFSLGADVAIALTEQGIEVEGLVVVDEGPDHSLVNQSTVNKILRTPIVGHLLHAILPAPVFRMAVENFLAPDVSLEAAFDDPAQALEDAQVVPYACFVASQEEKERFVAELPLDYRIARLGLATLVIFGEQDRIYQVEKSCNRYRAIPNATVQTIPAAGHSPVTEQPSRTAELIRMFVADR